MPKALLRKSKRDISGQIVQLYERSSLTVSLAGMKCVMKIAASEQRFMNVIDVKGAYLKSQDD